MVSVCHQNAAEFFKRDVDGLMRFFQRNFGVLGIKSRCDDGEDGVNSFLAGISNELNFDDSEEKKDDVLSDLKRDRKAIDAFTGGIMSKKEIRERLKKDMKKKSANGNRK